VLDNIPMDRRSNCYFVECYCNIEYQSVFSFVPFPLGLVINLRIWLLSSYSSFLDSNIFYSRDFEDLASLSRSAADWGKWYAEMHSFGTLIMIASSLLVLVEPYYFEATP
jgi:hypothetical protein